MPGRATYANIINEMDVSLAIERLLIAYYPTTWTPARIDLDAIPAGFYDLGSVVEDTPSFRVAKEKFSLKTGIPMVTQFEAITGVDGSFSVSLQSDSWRKAQFAFGNFTATASIVQVTTIVSAFSQSRYGLGSVTSIQVGWQYVIAATTPDFQSPSASEAVVATINSSEVIFSPIPTRAATIGDRVAWYGSQTQVIGSRRLQYYTILGVADFIDGKQVVHEIMKASAAGEWTEEIRPNQSGRLPMQFNALGVETTINSLIELVVAKRHYFPRANALI